MYGEGIRVMKVTDYQALAQFRFLIRQYLNNSERVARSVGLEPQHYLALLTVRGLPPGQQPTIRCLAERLQILHHSAVELVDRMQERGLVRRERSREDRRSVLLHVTPKGTRLLQRLVRHRLTELRSAGPELARALASVIEASPGNHSRGRRRAVRRKK
jgi:DNA-binding MarR family transcriptional regulator